MMTNLVVSQEGLRNYILEGVDNLRIRKCRPDRETIAHYVLRKYGGSLNDIFTELENIVDEGLLLKVEYKGSTSYRTPQSFDQKNSPLLTKHSKILNSSRTTRLILTTINDLLVQNPDYCTLGIPLTELKTKLREQEPVRFADDKVDTAFGREVSIGNVLLGDGGRVYPKDIQPKKNQLNNTAGSAANGKGSDGSGTDPKIPKKRGRKSNAEKAALAAAAAAAASGTTGDGPPPPTPPPTPVTAVKSEVEAKPEPPEVSGEAKIEEKVAEAVRKTFDGRVSGRNKIKRKVFDPSDVPTPSAATKVSSAAASSAKKKKRGSSSQEALDTCEICNRKNDPKNLIVCSSCAASYHTTCLGLTKEQLSSIDPSDWLCSECRICNACSSPLKSSNHVECVKCKSGFHTVCVGDEADFICGECVFTKGKQQKTQTSPAQSSPPAQQQQQSQSQQQQPAKRKGRPPKHRKVDASAPGESSPSQKKSPGRPPPPAATTTPAAPHKKTHESSNNKSQTSAEPVDVKADMEGVVDGDAEEDVDDNDGDDDVKMRGDDDTAMPVESAATPVKGDKAAIGARMTTTTEGSGEEGTGDDAGDAQPLPPPSPSKTDEKQSDLDGKQCSEWTPQDVEKFFNDKGLPEAGALFLEQEVDGLSLLLMKRSDVIFGLRLRLGPALKVYKLILQLQNNGTTVEQSPPPI